MKCSREFAAFIAAIGCTVVSAPAADRWWDGNDSTADADGGSGIWNTASTNWDDAATGGTDVAFAAPDNAIFGVTGGLVTLGESFINAGTVTFGVSGYEIATAGYNSAWAGLTGSGSFTKSGAGTLAIGGANTSYTGKISVTGGTISIASDGNLGSAPGSAVADQLTLNGGGLLVSATGQTLAANRGITLGAGGGKLDISALGFNGTLTVNSKITGTGALTLAGAGDTSASGGGNANLGIQLTNTANDFTGDVTITAGLVAYGNNSVFGNAANKIIFNGGGLIDNNVSVPLSRNIEVQAGGGYIRLWNASNVTWSGNLTGSGTINRTDMGTLTLSGDLSGYAGTFIQNGASAIATKLTGTATSIGGNWTATTGTITVDSSTNQSLAGTLSGTFAKSGAGTLTLTNATIGGNWTINTGGGLVASSASAQSMGGTISGAGTFTKSGAGTLTSTGRNTYSGLTTVSEGTLQLNDARSMNGAMAVSSGATLTIQSNGNGGYFQPSQLDVNNGTVNSVVSSANRYHGIYTTAINLTGTSSIATPVFISRTGIVGETLTITVASGGNASISGTILNHPDVSSGSLVKEGSGTLTLTGTQASGNSTTLTGNVTINSGTLNVGGTVNNSSPTVTAIGNMTTVGRTVTVNSGASLIFTAADAIGQYNYKTPVTLIADGGTITRVNGSFNSIGNITLRNGGRLTSANGQNASVNSFSLNGDVTVEGSSGSFIDTSGTTNNGIHLATGVPSSAITFNVASTGDSTADLTVSAPLKDMTLGGAAGIVKAGAGKMVVSSANSYSGGTTLRAGTLVARNSSAFGSSGTITVNDASTGSNNTSLLIDATSGSITIGRAITVANQGSGTATIGSATTGGSGQAIFSGAITLARAVTLRNSGFGDRLQFSGGISGTGDVTIDGAVTGSKTVFITTANTFAGSVYVTGTGKLQLSDGTGTSTSFIPDTSSVNLNTSGGNFSLAKGGNNETIDALNGVAGTTVTGISGNDTLTVGNGNGSGSYAGVIGGTLALTKAGSGTQTLSGNNTYTGATSVNAGTLAINGNQSGATGAVTVSNTGTRLMGSGTIGGATTINSGAIHSPGNSPGIQAFSGDLTYSSGSIFEWNLATSAQGTRGTSAGDSTSYDGVNFGGTLGGSGAIFRVVLDAGDFTDAFWDSNRTWSDIFLKSGTPQSIGSIFSASPQWYQGAIDMTSSTGTQGYFTISGTSLNWTAVPEPTGALAGLLLASSLLHRRRGIRC